MNRKVRSLYRLHFFGDELRMDPDTQGITAFLKMGKYTLLEYHMSFDLRTGEVW